MSTSSLRRRLEVGDLANASLSQNFCMIGTPLPAIDSKEYDANENKPIWEQEARDAQGRRRFHGAFTGGFSAGYYNTVGSKEGWTPTAFRSTRADKAAGKQTVIQSRPEDFMDEEDLAELRDARKIQANDRYGEQSKDAGHLSKSSKVVDDEPFGARFLDSLVKSKAVSVGMKILKRMGWKEGHGLGPLVTAERRAHLLQFYQNRSTPSLDEGQKGQVQQAKSLLKDDEARKHLFPPPDTQLLTFEEKEDRKGLGYKPSLTMAEVLRKVHSERKALRDSGHGGVEQRTGSGRLGDDSEDEDENMMGGNEAEDMQNSTLGEGARRQQRPTRDDRLDRFALDDSNRSRDRKMDEDDRVWSDGRPLPEGFRRAEVLQQPEINHKPPPIPRGWKPDRARILAIITNTPATTTSRAASGANLKPDERGSILGEAKIPGPAPSLADYLSTKAQERLAAQSKASPAGASEPVQQAKLQIPPLDSAVATAALKGYMPFGNDLAKQGRYRSYLESQASSCAGDASSTGSTPAQSKGPAVTLSVPAGMSIDQMNRELNEFAKSAAIFRPMNIAMVNRFRSADSAAVAKEMESPRPGLYQPPPAAATQPKSAETEKEKAKEKEKEEEEKRKRREEESRTPAQNAARAGMFGSMTRTTEKWVPPSLLCKRFGIRHPYPEEASAQKEAAEAERAKAGPKDDPMGNGDVPQKIKAPINPASVMSTWNAHKKSIQAMAKDHGGLAGPPDVGSSSAGKSADGPASGDAIPPIHQVGLGEDPTQGRDTLTYVKPSIDIFKAVFASDDEDSDVEEEEEKKEEAETSMADQTAASGATSSTPTKSLAYTPTEGVHETVLVRPTFVPKSKRQADTDGDADGAGEDGDTKSKKRKKDKEKDKGKKKKRLSTLSFGLDEEEGEDEGGTALKIIPKQPPKAPKAPIPDVSSASDQASAAPQEAAKGNRPRAADLF